MSQQIPTVTTELASPVTKEPGTGQKDEKGNIRKSSLTGSKRGLPANIVKALLGQ